MNLVARYPAVDAKLMYAHWTSSDALFRLKQIAIRTKLYPEIFAYGHIRVKDYLDAGLIRPMDRVFLYGPRSVEHCDLTD